MTLLQRLSPILFASASALGLSWAGSVAYAAPVPNEVLLVNAKTNKCVTIVGGVSTENNIESVQFDCDSDPSRRWQLNETASGIYQIKNVQTGSASRSLAVLAPTTM